MTGMRSARFPGPFGLLLAALLLSSCSTISSWWSDDERAESAPVQPKHERISAAAEPGGIEVLWQVDLDQRRPASPSGFSLPLAFGSGESLRIIAGAQDRRARIYDATGHEIDRVALLEASESGAARLASGLVVLGDVGGHVYAIDPATARIAWRLDLPSVLMSKPVPVADGCIIQTADNRIYRLDGKGNKLWSYIGPAGGLSMRLSPSPLLVDGQLYAAFSNGDVVAINAESGSLLWKRQLILDNSAAVLSELRVPVATPVLIPASVSGRDEDVLVVPVFQGELVFLSRLDGSRLDSRRISLKSSPWLEKDRLYVADAGGAVSALDASSGQTLWRQQISTGELTGPILAAGHLWVADSLGKVYRLDLDGRLLADVQLPGRIDRQPVASAAGILVRNSLGTLFLLQ